MRKAHTPGVGRAARGADVASCTPAKAGGSGAQRPRRDNTSAKTVEDEHAAAEICARPPPRASRGDIERHVDHTKHCMRADQAGAENSMRASQTSSKKMSAGHRTPRATTARGGDQERERDGADEAQGTGRGARCEGWGTRRGAGEHAFVF